jgi:small subunit ribosomal protein S17
MAEEEKDEQVTEAPQAEEPQAEAAGEAAAEAPAEVEAPAEEEAPAEAEAPADEEAPAEEEPAAAEDVPAEEPADDAEPAEALSPKQERKRARSAHAGEAGPKREAEDRQTERAAARDTKAKARRAYRLKSREKAKARRAAAPPVEPPPPVERPHGRAKVRQGVVVSDKADKTITVRVDMARRHPRYEKIVRSSSTLHAHDERNEANAGDTVRVIESRPLSRTKRWRLVEVLERAK